MHLIACHECDVLHEIDHLEEGAKASCRRCGATLWDRRRNSLETSLALAFAALILLVIANCFPFLAMKSGGFVQETVLATGIVNLYAQGLPGLATLVLFAVVLAPLIYILVLIYLLLPLNLGRTPPGMAWLLRFNHHLVPWVMIEVFLFGILVSIVKLVKLANIIPGPAVWAFGALMFVQAALALQFDPHAVWDRLGGQDG